MSETLPLVSVITPSLNQRAFIAQTIESVLSQAYPRLEYLVVDGGSTDGTLDVLRGYGARLRWLSEPDSGQSAAINKGWRMTRGNIVAWLNADDAYLPGAIQKVAAFFQTHPQIAAVYGDCDYVDADGQLIRPYPTRPYNYVALVQSASNFIPQPAAFIRRSVMETLGGLDESLHCVMDFDYWLRLGAQFEMAYLPERLATLRLHASAKSLRAIGQFGPELIRLYQRLFELPHLPPAVRRLRAEAFRAMYYKTAHSAFWAGEVAEAQRYGLLAWRSAPLSFRWLWMLLPLGRLGLWLARLWKKNPYHVGANPA
jgi:glycosyltransferase involved in cell wall biosynthesis